MFCPIRFLFSLKVLWQKENILQSIFYWLVRFCSYVLSFWNYHLSATTLMLLSFLFLFFVNVFCTATFYSFIPNSSSYQCIDELVMHAEFRSNKIDTIGSQAGHKPTLEIVEGHSYLQYNHEYDDCC